MSDIQIADVVANYAYHAVALYVVLVAVFIVRENRRPQATFAWMFLFLTVPVIGLVIYVLTGRGRRAFSREGDLVRQDLLRHLDVSLEPLIAEHEQALAGFRTGDGPSLRLATLVYASAKAVVTVRNTVDVLENADEAYPALLADIAAAHAFVHLQYYSWASDETGRRFSDLLLAKMREGVEVRVLYDPVGSLRMLDRAYLRDLRAGGIDIRPNGPLLRVHTIGYRSHRKLAVIDGRVGHVGGLNIGDEHIEPGHGFDIWRDTQVRLTGSVVRALQAAYAVDWENATGQELSDARYLPPVDEPGEGTELPVQLCLSGPDSEWKAIRQLYFAMITGARNRVWIASPFFILDESIAEAIKAAALEGVDVRIMVGARGHGQYLPYWAANTYAAEVTKAGAKVLLYEAGYLHAKTICVDGEVASVGSANWDIRSFAINYELNAVIYDVNVTARLEDAFRRDMERCRLFELDAYRRRSVLARLRDSIARLGSPLM